jgi:hypothetical protein
LDVVSYYRILQVGQHAFIFELLGFYLLFKPKENL